MPDDRLQRTRATLPAGYQFGDAQDSDQHLAAVERSAVANNAPCRHRGALMFDFTRNAYACPCGVFVPADL